MIDQLAKAYLSNKICDNCDIFGDVLHQPNDLAQKNIELTGCKLTVYQRKTDGEFGVIAPQNFTCEKWEEVELD